MREKPIIFSGEMVRAILNDSKTQTRRIIKPQPPSHHIIAEIEDAPGFWSGIPVIDGIVPIKQVKCPYEVGMHLWVRETWNMEYNLGPNTHKGGTVTVRYRATPDIFAFIDADTIPSNKIPQRQQDGWRPSIFMYRWASHILLEITDIKAEQVRDISEYDAKAEGVSLGCDGSSCTSGKCFNTYRYGFEKLWNKINKKRGFGWDVNPWVWKLSFRVLEPH